VALAVVNLPVTAHLENLGIDVVDADLVARVIVEPGQPALAEIAAHFGSEILQQDGTLDRAALRKIVFEDSTERAWLESLTHPAIRQEIESQLRRATSAYVGTELPPSTRSQTTQFCKSCRGSRRYRRASN
jgi:dephospho-CoA kinase